MKIKINQLKIINRERERESNQFKIVDRERERIVSLR